MIFKKWECQLAQQLLTSFVAKMESQSVESSSSQAGSKFAWEYLQIDQLLRLGKDPGLPAEIETKRPRWSELAKAGIVTQPVR